MSEKAQWQRQIETKLAAAVQRKQAIQKDHQRQMTETERRWRRFGEMGDELVRNILTPRLTTLAGYFDNARFLPAEEAGRYLAACEFRPTARFPARVRLEFSVGTDGQAENLVAYYRLQIRPAFFRFQSESQILFRLDSVDESRLTSWVEERLLDFVDTYLRLEELEPYQRENLVTDPVCGMIVPKPVAAGHVEYQGQSYFFCTEDCQKKFAEDPQHYLKSAKSPALVQ
jgi:YHS domain-containing protein